MNHDPRNATPLLAGPTAARMVGITAPRVRPLIRHRRLTVTRIPGSRPMVDVEQLRRLVKGSTTPALYGTCDPGFRG
jgi:hypothetical protein